MIDSGVFVAVVGPSGAGKDTILRYAGLRLRNDPAYHFVRRTITRPCDPVSEDHDTLDFGAFEATARDGAFAVTWDSHGLRYGIPALVDEHLSRGAVVVANISRGAISALRAHYASVVVVEITADPTILAARLSGRGRESGEAIAGRLARSPVDAAEKHGWIVVENNGAIEEAGERLVSILADL